ncbi:DNA ligase 4-like isoform X1 [Galleria mellonella]|uniref:DNA ligase 4 n=1 Tax=Galleria mellonella TaxID=7137 RepID=A0A6J3CAZ9_GALME|nr:DNA ligase 4-like isoform X1 [Galleria mellonella]XP_031768991.2 DNA ligase 4-like isoform X1 [Galleria mellonella]
MDIVEIMPANSVLFEDICSALERIYDLHKNQNKHKKKNVKEEQANILIEFFNDFKLTAAKVSRKKNSSIFPILRLLLPACERERNPYMLKEKKLGELLVKVLSIKNSLDARKLLEYKSVNSARDHDFASVAYHVIKNKIRDECGDLTVGEINEILDKVATAEVGNKGPVLMETFEYALKKLSAKQFKWFLRIILKDLKLAFGVDRILSAFHPDAPSYYKNCNNLYKVCEELDDGNSRPLELGVQLFCAVSPMLSERLNITQVSQRLSSERKYHVENKFDGERFQMHMKNGEFEYFSRRGHPYSHKYGKTYETGLLTPFLKSCFSPSVVNFILDGEMMGWHKVDKSFRVKGESFDVKKITEHSSLRPCFCVYDVLYYNDKVLVGTPDKGGVPLEERLKLLDTMFSDIPGVIQHSKRIPVRDSNDILDKLNDAIELQEEGIVVKDVASYYVPQARNAGWYKIKPEYTSETMNDLDFVIIGADEAENKRHGRANSFYVACADVAAPGEVPHRWVSVGRVSSGFSNEQLQSVCEMLERHWVPTKRTSPPATLVFNKKKPDFWIMPEHSIVLEIRATELIRSVDYGTSHTLRFPRLCRLRDDKPVNDVITLEAFNALTENKGNVLKLATKTVEQGQMEVDGVEIKPRKKRAPNVIQVHEQFRPMISGDVKSISKALLDRKIRIISGDEEDDLKELIEIVISHSGKHVLNVGPDTWCAVVGRMTARARDALESRAVDVVPTSWLRQLPPSPEPCQLRPLDLLQMKPSTSLNFRRDYDRFGDSYTQPVDEGTLKRCFEKMDTESQIYLTRREMLAVDKHIFEDGNPFSFLRRCTIYFHNSSSIYAILAELYGAVVCDQAADLTHVTVAPTTKIEDVMKLKNEFRVPVISENWLDECFLTKKLISEDRFIL